MFPLRIAFGSHARAGKSEATKYLVSQYGGKELSMGKAIYDILSYSQNRCGFSLEKDRKFLQMVGDWGRNKDPDVWINIVNKEVDLLPTENLYISDLRYLNEAKMLKNRGFYLVNIIRGSYINDNFGSGSREHSSETSLEKYKDWDYLIYNSKSLVEFYQQLDNIVAKISQIAN
uniref:Deoxynucleotide monophosphate kinase n=1 Tax=Marseillevirus LCMAC101 TaxID=2506602 RepID=A0A481YRR2_9VIRU|nr:MAG: deoxynucleotide monophosphate kinase [Marseillevirus LCMAC101]